MVMLGLRDYVTKNRFPRGAAGAVRRDRFGIVSAVAVDALGREKVKAYMLPSPIPVTRAWRMPKLALNLLGIAYEGRFQSNRRCRLSRKC